MLGHHSLFTPKQPVIPTFSKKLLSCIDSIHKPDAWSEAIKYYHIGADLINQGLAYGSDNASQQVVQEYLNLPRFSAFFRDGFNIFNNPLLPLLVIKVALDHSIPEEIIKLFRLLKSNSKNDTADSSAMSFPNQCSMYNKTAFLQLLRAYILNHNEKFSIIPDNLADIDDPRNRNIASLCY